MNSPDINITGLNERLNLDVRPLALGRFSRQRLRFEHSQHRGIVFPADREMDVARLWSNRLASNPTLFDGLQVRLDSYRLDGDSLVLKTSLTSYREFVGTNLEHPEWGRLHGPKSLANPIGLSGLILTTDQKAVLGRRSQSVAEYPGFIDSVGGNLSPIEHLTDGIIDPFKAMIDEVCEELTIRPSSIESVTCVGLWENLQTLRPELVFEVETSLDSSEIGIKEDEHSELFIVSRAVPELMSFVILYEKELTPSCKAAMLGSLASSG